MLPRAHDAGVDADRRLADGGAQVGSPLVVEHRVEGRLDAAHRCDRARLRHAPGLHDRQARLGAVALRQRSRHRRSTAGDGAQRRGVAPLQLGQHAHPDGGHPGRDRDPLLLDELGERRRGQVGTWHHEAGAAGHRGVRQAPGVGVEHRHDRQDAIALLHARGCRPTCSRACAGRSIGASRRRPSGCRSCRSCRPSPRRGSRRSRRTAPATRRRAGPRSRGAADRRRGSAPRPCRRPSRRCGAPSRAGRRAATGARAATGRRRSPRPRRGSRCRRAARGTAGCSACAAPGPCTGCRSRARGGGPCSTRTWPPGRPR